MSRFHLKYPTLLGKQVNKFSASYGIRKLIIVFTRSLLLSRILNHQNPVHTFLFFSGYWNLFPVGFWCPYRNASLVDIDYSLKSLLHLDRWFGFGLKHVCYVYRWFCFPCVLTLLYDVRRPWPASEDIALQQCAR